MRKINIILLASIILTSFACRLGLPGNQPPGPAIVISTEEASRFEDEIKIASDNYSNTGQAELHISEAEITSFVFYQLQSQNQTIISEPQIFLRDGKIQLFAEYSESGIPVDIVIILTPYIESGRLNLELEKVLLGPAAAPDLLVEKAQRIIDEQVEPGFNKNLAGEFNIEAFSVTDGILSISGKKP